MPSLPISSGAGAVADLDCRKPSEAERALGLAQEFLAGMQLQVNPEKTKISHFKEGFNFLGFAISSWGVNMRAKSKEKFKEKIREVTQRSHNLDQKV